jgi:hypothetical protein
MGLNKRDKEIIDNLTRFRVMSRDDIIDLHFSHLKHPVTNCNGVLKRLRRDNYIDVTVDSQPYLYFPAPCTMKKDSMKIRHFLAIVDFYKQVRKIEEPEMFIVEPKFGGKGLPEADVFMLWKKSPWMVEIQRNIYSTKVLTDKMNRYTNYYMSNDWQQETWQSEGDKIFPHVWFITDHQYTIEKQPFRVIQSKSVDDLFKKIKPKQQAPTSPSMGGSSGGIKLNFN